MRSITLLLLVKGPARALLGPVRRARGTEGPAEPTSRAGVVDVWRERVDMVSGGGWRWK